MTTTTKLDAEDLGLAREALKNAIFHLASCWDALSELEGVIGTDVETDAISGITSSVTEPADVFTMGDEELDAFLDSIESEDEEEN